jgi:hypothetical protein
MQQDNKLPAIIPLSNLLARMLSFALLLAGCGALPESQVTTTTTPASEQATATTIRVETAPTLPPIQPSLTAGSEEEWLTLEHENISIQFPGKPKETSETTETLIGPITTYTATLTTPQQQQFTLLATTYPNRYLERDDPGGLTTVEAQLSTALAMVRPVELDASPVFLGPYVGREVQAMAGDSYLTTQIYIVGTTIYQTTATGSISAAGGASKAEGANNRFLASLALREMPPPPVKPWQPFNLSSIKASLFLPDQPKEQQRTETIGGIGVTRLAYSVEQPDRGVRFEVSAIELPTDQQAPTATVVALAQSRRDALVQQTQGQLIAETPFTFGEASGQEITIALTSGGYLRARLLPYGNRFYELILHTQTPISSPAEGMPLVPTASEIGWFFLSFNPNP